jgi:hypothetical protein
MLLPQPRQDGAGGSQGSVGPAWLPDRTIGSRDTRAVSRRKRNFADVGSGSRGWVVKEVRGRHSTPRSDKGLAAVHSMALERPDGSSFVINRIGAKGEPVAMDEVLYVEYYRFDQCPICLDAKPTTNEQVPPQAIGGSVMTVTCERCNNGFGSVIEPDLVDWWEDALVAVRISNDNVAGARRTPDSSTPKGQRRASICGRSG